MTAEILAILHQENSTPGRVGTLLERRGYRIDARRPRFGDPLPSRLDDHAGVVVFGGPMSANDCDGYLSRETDWLAVPLREKKPFLGICLGAQMLARHLGACVEARSDGRVEIGYYPLRPTPAGRGLMEWPRKAYQWHREGFALPLGSTLLAEGDCFPNQAFRYGPAAYGIQFHPEVTLAMLHRWTVRGAPRMTQPGAQNRRQHFDGHALYDAPLRAWLENFLDLWLPPAKPAASD